MSLLQQDFSQKFFNAYQNHVVPRLTKRTQAIGISVAVALSFLYIVNDLVFRPPRNLRHLPALSYYSVLKSFAKGQSLFDKGRLTSVPLVEASTNNGIYVEIGITGWEVQVSNPEDAKKILLKTDIFPKVNIGIVSPESLFIRFIGGRNILTLVGHDWKEQRKVANPAFHRAMPVKLFGHLTQDLFLKMDSLLEQNQSVEITGLMMRWTLDVIGKAGFGFDFHAVTNEDNEWVTTYNQINDGLRSRLFIFFNILDTKLRWLFPERVKAHKALDEFLGMLDRVIISKRELVRSGDFTNENLDDNEKDLLTLLIESELSGEGVLTDEELKSNLCLFFFAGHDTTSSTLSFSLYHLAKNPEIQQKAREEAINILGDSAEDVLPTTEDTKRMTYINQIMKETLRINDPVARLAARKLTEDTVLSDNFIPKGSHVVVNVYNIHHANTVWNDGYKFNPDRFAEDGEAAQNAGRGMTWLPFSNGGRQCIGMKFSLNEQRVMLSMLLRKYTWSLPEDSPHRDEVLVEGFPVNGPKSMNLIFKKRY